MPKLKLTYFDIHGGRGEPARLALSIGGIPFEDDRLAPSDWQRRKPDTPFGALPVLEVDGQALAQSNAVNRYVGKLTDLYPSDAWQAALCDEIMEAVEDISTKLAATFFLAEEEKKTQRKALVEGADPVLSHATTAAARSAWRPLLRCGPSNSRRSQGLRVDPTS
jgi:glutathione S-transferase